MKLLGSIFFCLFFSLCAQAQKSLQQSARIQGITAHFDSMDRDAENELIDLEGNVQVIYQEQHLECQKARINLRAKTIDAIGNVTVTTTQATISGARVILDYETSTGLILDGFVQSGNVIFEGNQIHKVSETEYIADQAHYTTCTTCPEAWSFSGSKIRAQIGGYAYIKNAFLRFGDFPVFWLPYLAVPLKSDRQSGFLTPSLERSTSGGLAYSQSYFWALSRSADSTWTFKNYEFRGLKGLTNYRYVLTPNSSGELDAGFLHDKVFGENFNLNNFHKGQKNSAIDRWFLKYQHYYELPDGLVHRVQLNNASDLQYPHDFPLETNNLGDSTMENRMSVTKNTNSQHFSLDTSYYKNMQQTNPTAGNEDAVHRLPELRFSQIDTKLANTDFLYTFDLNYVNFARSNFGYDDLKSGDNKDRYVVASDGSTTRCDSFNWEKDPSCHPIRDGKFDENIDLIRTGQRLDFKPTLYRPMKFENLDLLPKITYRETQYTFPVDGPHSDSHNTRRYIRADISARSSFSRIYGDFSKLQSERIKHEIQPEVTATTIPWLDQPKHTFFGDLQDAIPLSSQESVSDSDLKGDHPAGLQFDYNDRVYDRKLVTFGMTNKFTRKTWTNGAPVYLQFVSWKLAQSYDVYSSERNPNGQPLSDLLSELKITLQKFQVYQRANYYPYQKVTNTSTRVRVNDELGNFFQTEHILSYQISPGQTAVGNPTEELTFSAKKSIRWIDLIGKVNYDLHPPEHKNYFKSWGYGAQIKAPGDCLYFTLTNYQITGGDINYQLNVAFVWDGKEKEALNESILSGFGF